MYSLDLLFLYLNTLRKNNLVKKSQLFLIKITLFQVYI